MDYPDFQTLFDSQINILTLKLPEKEYLYNDVFETWKVNQISCYKSPILSYSLLKSQTKSLLCFNSYFQK